MIAADAVARTGGADIEPTAAVPDRQVHTAVRSPDPHVEVTDAAGTRRERIN